MDLAINKKEELARERKCKALVRAILNRFCQCEARENIQIRLQKQGDMSRLAGRLQNYMNQQDTFKSELVTTYGLAEMARLIKEY